MEPIGVYTVGIEDSVSVIIDIPAIVRMALMNNAKFIVISHNHPSGNLKPSEADFRITKRLKEAAKLFSIDLIDHIILTASNYYSIADSGEMPV